MKTSSKSPLHTLTPHHPPTHPLPLYSLQLLAEILDGVKIYFDFMLVDHLLYEPEKQQFERAMSAGTCNSHSEPGSKRLAPSDVYGVEHLLRLMVKLPLFLTHTQLPASHVAVINTHLKDFMRYIYICNT